MELTTSRPGISSPKAITCTVFGVSVLGSTALENRMTASRATDTIDVPSAGEISLIVTTRSTANRRENAPPPGAGPLPSSRLPARSVALSAKVTVMSVSVSDWLISNDSMLLTSS